jgi:alpha-1,3/alpha-1,6-mannosyltransferase
LSGAILTQLQGGYDKRVPENVSYHNDLVSLTKSLGLSNTTASSEEAAISTPENIEVLFILSVPASLKARLLQTSTLLLYTPSNEHFGIVPLEAMLARTPVLAANTGGPTETVVDGETGWLRPVDEVSRWTDVLSQVLQGMTSQELTAMGEKGRIRVIDNFSKEKMAQRLDAGMEVAKMIPKDKRPGILPRRLIRYAGTLLGIAVALLYQQLAAKS